MTIFKPYFSEWLVQHFLSGKCLVALIALGAVWVLL